MKNRTGRCFRTDKRLSEARQTPALVQIYASLKGIFQLNVVSLRTNHLVFMNTDTLKQLYLKHTGQLPETVEPLPGAGSNRKYYRLNGAVRCIGVCGTSPEENAAFIYMAEHFRKKCLPVPEVYAVSDDKLHYLQEDLGDVQLFQLIRKAQQEQMPDKSLTDLLGKAIRLLPKFQFEGGADMDFTRCYPPVEFNRRTILWDLNYFKYCFLKTTGLEFEENALEDDFERMCGILLEETSEPTFMYRDFQSRNVMIKDGEPYFIDFQGGRKGPFYYDVASFLWQAKANFPDDVRKHLTDEYLDAIQAYRPVSKAEFTTRLRHFVLFRTLQVLGAYGFRGYFEQKTHFIESVPFAIGNLRQLLDSDFTEYPYLCNTLRRMTDLPRFAYERNKKELTVTVISFSYKKGIPEDTSGNGGGYVFDCRAVHNPGRYDRYKPLTGLDEPVIRFLEDDGEITSFLTHVDALVDAHVDRFIERGFTHLSVCFGCTGGQHRSVYSAQHVAEHLHEKFNINVHLIHREQHIEKLFKPKTSL